jgi:WD40 repeat protein
MAIMTSPILYFSTFHYRACAVLLEPTAVAIWLEELATAGVTVPFYLIYDLGSLILHRESTVHVPVLGESEGGVAPSFSPARSNYLSFISHCRQLIKECELFPANLPPRVVGQMLAKILVGLTFSVATEIPPSESVLPYLWRLLRPDDPSPTNIKPSVIKNLAKVFWAESKLYPTGSDNEKIYAQLQSFDRRQLTNAAALGTGTAVAPTKLASLLETVAVLPEAKVVLSFVMRLLPLFNGQMHGAGSQSWAMGGYNDVSRRGALHNILLSELAYPEEEFLRRLSEGETLYYKHTAPPQPQPYQTVALFDGSPLTWGNSRLLGVAATLALAVHAQRQQHLCWLVTDKDTVGDSLRIDLIDNLEKLAAHNLWDWRQLQSVEDIRYLLSYRRWQTEPLLAQSTAPLRDSLITHSGLPMHVFWITHTDFTLNSTSIYPATTANSWATMLSCHLPPQGQFIVVACGSENVTLWQWQADQAEFRKLKEIKIANLAAGITETHRSPSVAAPPALKVQAFLRLGHLGEIQTYAYSQDGSYLATVGLDDSYRLWTAHNGQMLWYQLVDQLPSALTFSPISNWIAEGYSDGKVVVRAVPSGEVIKKWDLGVNARIRAVSFSPDEQILAIALENFVQIYPLPGAGGDHITAANWQFPDLSYLAFDATGRYLQIVSQHNAHLLDTRTLRVSQPTLQAVKQLVVIGERMVLVSRQRIDIYELNEQRGKSCWEYQRHLDLPDFTAEAHTYWLSPDGEKLFTLVPALSNEELPPLVHWYNLATGKLEKIFSFTGKVSRISANLASRLLIALGHDGTLEAKRWVSGETLWRVAGQQRRNIKLSASDNGNYLLWNDKGQGCYLWPLISTNASLQPINLVAGSLSVGFEQGFLAPSGDKLLLINNQGIGSLLDLAADGAITGQRRYLTSRVVVAHAFAAAQWLAIITDAHKLEIYDTTTGAKEFWSEAVPNRHLLSFSAQHLAFLQSSGVVAIWDLQTRRICQRLEIGKLLALKLASEGNFLYALGARGNFESWNLAGERVFSQVLDTKGHYRAKILDSRQILFYGRDRNVLLLNRISGEVRTLGGHLKSVVDCLAAGPFIITADYVGCVRLFDRRTAELLLTLYIDDVTFRQWVAFRNVAAGPAAIGARELLSFVTDPPDVVNDPPEALLLSERAIREFLTQFVAPSPENNFAA